MKSVLVLLGAALLAVVASISVSADSHSIDFETGYVAGSVNGQDGWSSTGPYDQAIVGPTGVAGFGTKSLRISNAVTSGSFGDHTFSKSLLNEAGESSAANGGMSGGTRVGYFDAEWDFASTVPGSEQAGLTVVASPDRGDGARMSWVQMADTPGGLDVNFYDYQSGAVEVGCPTSANFVFSPVATGLDRTVPHTIRITMAFVDGVANDVVNVYVDGVLGHTGTSWEDYFRECETTSTRTVDSILFRTGGTAVPATLGFGFLIDNLTMGSSLTTADDIFVRTDGSDAICDGTVNVPVGVFVGANQPCAVLTLGQALMRVNAGGNIHVEQGTYTTGAQVLIDKDVDIDGNTGPLPVFKPGYDTAFGSTTDAAAWFRTTAGTTVNISDLEFDGDGANFKVFAGIRFQGDGSLMNVSIHEVQYEPSGGAYSGFGVQVRPGAGNVDISDSTFTRNGRDSVFYRGPGAKGTISNNTFTGKGDGDWLDYAIEAGSGAVLSIDHNTIKNNTGVASVDGSDSAGVLLTTFFGPGTAATLTSNTLLNNSTGIFVGYDDTDTSTVVAHFNRLVGNDAGVATTNANVNAENNWWGCNEGPGATGCDTVENDNGGVVDFTPWLVLSVGAPDNMNAPAEITADLNHNSNGVDLSGGATLPDGSNVSFDAHPANRAIVSDSIVQLVDGMASTTLNPAANDGLVTVPTKFDNETVFPIVRIDRVAPTRTIVLPDSTDSTTVAVTVTGTDLNGSLVDGYCLKETTPAPAANDACFIYPKPTTFALSAGDGTKTVYLWTRDAAGNVSNVPALVADTTELDSDGTLATVAISIPPVTNTRDISVDVSAFGGPTAYILSQNATVPTATDGRWSPTLPTTFRLSTGDGTKTVYAWVKNALGVVSATASDTTLLDTTAPTASIESKPFIRTKRAPIKVTGTDAGSGIAGYYVSLGIGQPAAGASGWLGVAPVSARVPGPDGTKTIYAWTKDAAGNVSPTASVQTMLDTTKPTSRILFPINGSKLTRLPFVSGVAFDKSPGSGVLRTLVSIRREAGSDCFFWSGRQWVKKGCGDRVWLRFRTDGNWQVKRGFDRKNFAVPGTYSIFTRAGDRAANVSPAKSFVLGVNWVKFTME